MQKKKIPQKFHSAKQIVLMPKIIIFVSFAFMRSAWRAEILDSLSAAVAAFAELGIAAIRHSNIHIRHNAISFSCTSW